MKKFEITYYFGPDDEHIVKPEIIDGIAENGITLVPLRHSAEINKKALELLEKKGICAIVNDPRINDIYGSNDIAGAEDMAKAVVEEYKAFDNIIGWDIVDEPHIEKFPVLSAIVRGFRKYSPEYETYINLYPIYAKPEELGTADYTEYLESFVNAVNPHLLSYDHYHFLDRNEPRIKIKDLVESRKGFFENIEIFRHIAKKHNIDSMMIVLLTEHGPYRNVSRAELFWEINMCLAYGMRRISYFTYWQPDAHDLFWLWNDSMCDVDGNKCPHYYDAQAINAKVYDVGKWLFDKESTEVFHIGAQEEGTREFSSFGGISEISGNDGVIGFFSDGSAYLVNRSFREENTFELHSEKSIFIRSDGEFIPLENTKITLGAGEAVLIKIC